MKSRSIVINARFNQSVFSSALIFVGLMGFTLFGCSDVNRVSVTQFRLRLIQDRMEAASILEEANCMEETGTIIFLSAKISFADLEEGCSTKVSE